MRHHPYEIFACLFLDNRHRIIVFEELFRGTIDGASVHPREVVRRALHHNAAAVILSHNHPSGIAEPSQADERITKRLKSALELVDIRLLDHLIIGDGQAVSLARRGLI
jgi:DNA repair protein RadC